MKKLLLITILLFPVLSYAYDLNGVILDNDDGTHSVRVENKFGYPFSGTALDQDDGNLMVTVEDGKGGLYSGTGTSNGVGGYELELKNDVTGSGASGTLGND
jgi:hypothetical protein